MESFSSSAGLLTLDEPSAALNSETTEELVSVMESLREMAKDLNMQIICITHHKEFLGCFDQLIEF
jgi:DNA repair exonuclease SbcCD ATPase subunit